MRFVVMRVCFFFITILMSVSVIRVCFGSDSLSVSTLLELLSRIDIDFSATVGQFAKVYQDFTLDGKNFWEAFVSIFTGVYDLLTLPISLLLDLLSFLNSVVQFIVNLLGFNIFGTSNRPLVPPGGGNGGSSGGGGGGGGSRPAYFEMILPGVLPEFLRVL